MRPSSLIIATAAVTPLLLASRPGVVSHWIASCLHLFRFCFASLAEADSLLHGFPAALVGAGLLYALGGRIRRYRTAWHAIARMPQRPPRPRERMFGLARKHGALRCIRIVDAPLQNPVFTAGLLEPRIYVTSALQRTLSLRELEAVLLHELNHVRRRDPARAAAATFLADVLFWLPVVRESVTGWLMTLETRADDSARRLGDDVVASAILKVARFAAHGSPGVALVGRSTTHVESRVRRLLGQECSHIHSVPRTLARSVTALTIIWVVALVTTSAHAAQGNRDDHCVHAHRHIVLHAS